MAELMEGQACALPKPPLPADTVLAMAYVPFQRFCNLYPPERALEAGTLFADLDKPFLGGGLK